MRVALSIFNQKEKKKNGFPFKHCSSSSHTAIIKRTYTCVFRYHINDNRTKRLGIHAYHRRQNHIQLYTYIHTTTTALHTTGMSKSSTQRTHRRANKTDSSNTQLLLFKF